MPSQLSKRMMRRCALLFLAGTALHLLLGPIDPSILTYPWSLILALNYLYLLILLQTNSERWTWVQKWNDRASYITSLSSMLVLTLLFGLIRQDGSEDGLFGILGFTSMSSSWIFNLFLFQFTSIIGLKAVDDIWHWQRRKSTTIMMHASFFIILLAAIFGSGDKVRIKVVLSTGTPQQTGITTEGKQMPLPFALTLKKFSLDEYPPHIHLYNKGIFSSDFVIIDKENTTALLDKWQLECLKYLDMAACLHEDSGYVALQHIGATTAIYMKATCTETKETAEGWISCGSYIFRGRTLPLPDGSELVMPRREVKKYLSKIELTENDKKKSFDISVNHPACIGPWKIYQSGYDSERGRWSNVSILECVKDGWYPAIHISMWIILVTGILIFITGWHKRNKNKE